MDVTVDLLLCGVFVEDGRAGESEQLRFGKEPLDGFVVLTKLRTMAFVKDEDYAFVLQGLELFFVGRFAALFVFLVSLAVFVQRQPELLNGGDDDFVGIVVGK